MINFDGRAVRLSRRVQKDLPRIVLCGVFLARMAPMHPMLSTISPANVTISLLRINPSPPPLPTLLPCLLALSSFPPCPNNPLFYLFSICPISQNLLRHTEKGNFPKSVFPTLSENSRGLLSSHLFFLSAVPKNRARCSREGG